MSAVKFYLTALWGEEPREAEQDPILYTFNSKEERDAFCQGADEMAGWLGADWKRHDEYKTFKKSEFANWREDD